MKIEIEIDEAELRELVYNIPPDFFTRPGVSPVRTLARVLVLAWAKMVKEGKVKP